jgi:hypothetical protein
MGASDSVVVANVVVVVRGASVEVGGALSFEGMSSSLHAPFGHVVAGCAMIG